MALLKKFTLAIVMAAILSHVCSQDGVTLSLRGASISNNGYVDIDDIGEDNNALLCHTNKSDCCRNDNEKKTSIAGEWYFPNRSALKKLSEVDHLPSYFYRNREYQVVRLNHVGGGRQSEYGKFHCIVPNATGIDQTIYVNIVNMSAVMISPEHQTTETAGTNITLNCSFWLILPRNVVPPHFEWFFGPSNTSLPVGVTVSNVTNNSNTYTSTLQFSPLNQSHAGKYTCRVGGNQRLAVSAVITVNYITVGLEHINYTVLEGYTVSICFAVQGGLSQMAEVTLSTVVPITSMGEVAPTNFVSETINLGATTCIDISTNYDKDVMNVDKQFNVTVSSNTPAIVVDPAMATALITIQNIPPPDIVPMIKNVTLGGNTTFRVSANFSSLNLKFQWLYNNTNVSSGGRSSVLMVMNVTKEDGGTYSCIMSFPFGGNITSKESQLFVFSPATIHEHPSDKAVAQGGTINFSVNVSGDGLTYQWQRNGKKIPSNDSRFEGVFKAVLEINNAKVEDAGRYQCIVFNGARDNVTSNEATLTVTVPPSHPVITNTSFGSNSIAINWQRDDAVEYYQIQYNFTIRECKFSSKVNMQNRTVNTTKSGIVLNGPSDGIEEDSDYNISLIAINSNGNSQANMIMNTTKEAAPIGVPTNVTNTSISSTSIAITWDRVACVHRNGEIDGYNVTYYPKGDKSDGITVIVRGVTGRNRTFLASGLQPLTKYNFEVQAFNGDGNGPEANATFQTSVFEGIGFFLNNKFYPNNSLVNLEEIGAQNKALLCLTNNISCCENTSTVAWYGPGEVATSIVAEMNNTTGFFTSRGPSVICLNKINGTTGSSGVFHCRIPDADGNDQTIYIGIYPNERGHPVSVNLIFINPTLICTSTGGPATNVTWKKNQTKLEIDGTQSQIITDTQNAEYKTMLTLPMTNIEYLDSTYECIVENGRGSGSASLKLEGFVISIIGTLVVGEPGVVKCTSVIAVEELLWLDKQENKTLANLSSNTTATLDFNPVNDSIHNKTFTCRAIQIGMVDKHIKINISAPSYPVVNATITHSLNKPIVGKPYNLTCLYNVSKGFTHKPSVLWKHPNRTNFSSSLIVFDALHASNRGNYICEVIFTSPVLKKPYVTVQTYNLTIQLPSPNVSISVPNTTLHAGSTVNLTCSVTLARNIDVNITLNVTWLRRSSVNTTTLLIVPTSNPNTNILTLSPLSAMDENITCLVRILPTEETSLFLIEGPPLSVSISLAIENPTINITMRPSSEDIQNVGDKFNITCSVSGLVHLNPVFTYQWTNNSDGFMLTTNSIISFPSLTLYDAGEYTCKVSVSSDYFVGRNVTGMKNYGLSIKLPEPSSVVLMSSPQMIFAGSNFTLHCSITLSIDVSEVLGSLRISVNWTGPADHGRMIQQLDADGNSLHYNTSILVGSSLGGTYTCAVQVKVIDSSYLISSSPLSGSTEVNIIQAPLPPSFKSLQSLNSTSVEIVWMKGSDTDVVDYVNIEYTYKGPCDCTDQNMCQSSGFNQTNTNFTISDLQEYSRYLFKITAYNQIGPSSSKEMNVTTFPATPSGVPESLRKATSNLTSITIDWNTVKCIDRNSDITGYVIKFNGTNATSNTYQFTASYLLPSTTYTFQVAAMSINGTGPFKNTSVSTSSPKDVSLLLNSQALANNSIVAWTDIGEGSASLMCLTNKVDCCRGVSDSGKWLFPNETRVDLVHKTQIHQQYWNNAIFLQRFNETQLVNGIFRCDIMDESGDPHHLYVGIYEQPPTSGPELNLTYSLTNDINITFVLNCTSIGIPVSQMKWLVNNSPIEDSDPFPILADAVEGHYFSTLSRETEGEYSCVVTDGINASYITTQSISILKAPTFAQAVWIIGKDSFHVCWNYPASALPRMSTYRIIDSQYDELINDLNNSNYSIDIVGQHNSVDNFVLIQVLPSTQIQSFPSKPLRVNVSASGVKIFHNNNPEVNHGDILPINSIGENDMALICMTDRRNCCKSSISGEWYYPNGTQVPIGRDNWRFYRNRKDNPDQVLLNQRIDHEDPSEPGVYCCAIPDKDNNCDITQNICVNLVSLATIIPSENNITAIAGEEFNLNCTAAVGSRRVSTPSITWFSPNSTVINSMTTPKGLVLERSNTTDIFISTLRFTPVQSLHMGNYTCHVQFGQSNESSSIYLNVIAPTIEARLSRVQPIAGESFILNCSVYGAENLNSNKTYQWMKNRTHNSIIIVRETSSTLNFSSFSLSDAGVYTCRVIVSSDYLDNILSVQNSTQLDVQMPDPASVLVQSVSTQGKPLFLPSSGNITSVTLSCTVRLNPAVNVPVTVQTSWNGPEGFRSTNTAVNVTDVYHISMAIIDSLNLKKAGIYRCTATVMPSFESEFIMSTGTEKNTTTLALFTISAGKPEQANYTVGDAVNIQCDVNSEETEEDPMIFWSRGDSQRVTNSNKLLHFSQLMASDAVTYFCHASFGSAMGKEDLTVTVKLDMELTMHLNMSEPVKAGDSVSIVCHANINRTLINVNTDIDVHLIGPSQIKMTRVANTSLGLYQASIIFPSISTRDSGQYKCNATVRPSTIGYFLNSAHKKDNFDLILIPSRPVINSNNLSVQHNSIRFDWSQDPYDRVDYYLIDYSSQNQCNHPFNYQVINHTEVLTKRLVLNALEEFSSYQIRIMAVNSKGNNSANLTVTTLSSVPSGKPSNISARALNSTSILIRWNEVDCWERNGIITIYNVQYQPDRYSVPQMVSETVNIFLMVTNLIPSTSYTFRVAAENVNGTGPDEVIRLSTDPVKSVALFHNGSFHPNNSIINEDEIGEGAMSLLCFTNKLDCCGELPLRSGKWYFPNKSRVDVQNNGVVYRDKDASVVRLNWRNYSDPPNGVFRCQIPDMNDTVQNVYVGVYPRNAGKPQIENIYFSANHQSLTCVSANGPATDVIWERNEVILSLDGIKYSQIQLINNTTESIYVNTLYIRNLNPEDVAGNYSCTIRNLRDSMKQGLEIKGIRVTGHESAFRFGTPAAQLNCTTDLAVNLIEWLDARGKVLINGTDSLLELIVTPLESLMYMCRIKGVFGNQSKNITLTVMPEASSVLSRAAPAIITVILLAVLLLVLIATSMLIVRRKRQGKLVFPQRVKSKLHSTFVIHATPLHGVDRDSDDEKLEMSTFGKSASVKHRGAVVPVEEFEHHVKNMHNDRDQLFETEYASFRKDPQRSYAAADTMVNRLRNRFGNIFPYDHCRVKLKEIAGYEHSDYINASYMDGYQKQSAYIAAQGPLPNTLEDFWRMIWEKRLTTIVMLTQCFEGRKKCECYWPDNINVAFEPGQGIKVILTSMVPFSEYTIRKMTVTRTTEPQLQPLEVIQLHFVAWPDHGVPDNCTVMLNFIRRVRKLHPYSNPCPLLVHCSAGVGRTGTFIVLDTMLERMKAEDTLNVYDYVKQLREQRVLMVQTLAQYMFIHDALKEYILCGQTEIVASDIRNVIDNLSVQHDPCSAASGFEHQFQILGQLQYVTEENSYSNATSEQNIGKNRYSNKLPNNFYRVRLKSSAVPGSDYINASFIHGYRQKKTYIATQGPVESTVCDFWRMVWENESKCIVLLGQLKENDKEMCCCYWPTTEGHTQTYGQITVKFLTEERYGYCDLRKFEIDEEKAGVEGVKTAFTVTQFHFLEWPEHETPPITSSLIELMGNVNRVQMGAASKPMIVMCNDGVGRTGTFICIHAQLERLKTEGVFDFFQFIKSARIQRAGLVSDSVQYVLCHEVLADYLDSFDTYANFKEVM